jgi:hypothetical protein
METRYHVVPIALFAIGSISIRREPILYESGLAYHLGFRAARAYTTAPAATVET